MVFNNSTGGMGEIGQEMAYDLRQTYAKIVGDHLEDIAVARKADRYDIYFKTLKDLFVIVQHKFKKKGEFDDDGNKISDEEKYGKLLTEAVTVANKFPRAWLGEEKDPNSCAEIEAVLNAIEMFLYSKIEIAGMFGGNKRIPGL